MDKLWAALMSNAYPTTMVSGLILLVIYLRKQESGVRTELNTTLQRLQREKEALQALVDRLEAEAQKREEDVDKLRAERRAAEDREDVEKRRADRAEADLKRNIGDGK